MRRGCGWMVVAVVCGGGWVCALQGGCVPVLPNANRFTRERDTMNRMWAQDKAAGASVQEFQRLGRGHMRTLVAAAQQVEEETDTDDEGKQLHHEKAGLKQEGAHDGGAGGGGRPRYNDPSCVCTDRRVDSMCCGGSVHVVGDP